MIDRSTPAGKGWRTALQGYAALLLVAVAGVATQALTDLSWQPAWLAVIAPAIAGAISRAINAWEDRRG